MSMPAHYAFRTQLTRQMMEGKRNPTRNMRNFKALILAAHKRAWEKRMKEKKDKAS